MKFKELETEVISDIKAKQVKIAKDQIESTKTKLDYTKEELTRREKNYKDLLEQDTDDIKIPEPGLMFNTTSCC